MRKAVFGMMLLAGCQSVQDTSVASTGATPAAQPAPAPASASAPAVASPRAPAFPGQRDAPQIASNAEYEVTTLATGLESPWAIEGLDDGRFLVTEKPGRLRVVTADGRLLPPIAGVPAVDARDQGGLLDVAVHWSGGSSWTVCMSYAEPREGGKNGTAVACGEAVPDGRENLKLQNVRTIFRQQPAWASTKHYGSRVLFTPDEKLFITLGERSVSDARHLAQDLDSTLGKVVRVEPNGMSSPDNPFYKQGPGTPRTQVWSYGHRNIQSAVIDPATGKLWTVEHGPKGGDELNLTEAGKNYGWPVITYGLEYSGKSVGEGITAKAGMEQPVYYWDPVIAPSGMTIYTGDLIPQWTGSLFVGGLKSQGLVRLVLKDNRVAGEERIALGARIRDVITGPDGFLYALTDGKDGRILQIGPKRPKR